MDWKTAKNYIIILLAIMNILLLLSIMSHNNNASIDNPYFSNRSMENFNKLLKEKGIALSVEMPKEIHTVGVYNVEYEDLTQERYADLFRDLKGVKTSENSKKLLIEIPSDELIIRGVRYLADSEAEREIFAERFLRRYFPDRSFRRKYTNDGRFVFNPLFGQVLFEESFIEFAFEEKKVIIQAMLIIPKEESPNKKDIMSSVEAVLNALPQLSEGDRIVGLDFIYYFDLNEEELYRVKNARAFPSWRIITEKGKVIYILAFKN